MGKYSEARAAAKQPFSLFDALCACSCMAGRENQAYFGKPPKIPQDAKPQSDVISPNAARVGTNDNVPSINASIMTETVQRNDLNEIAVADHPHGHKDHHHLDAHEEAEIYLAAKDKSDHGKAGANKKKTKNKGYFDFVDHK